MQFLNVLAAARAKRERDWLMFLVHFWHAGRNSEILALTPVNIRNGYIYFERLKRSNACEQKLVDHPNDLLNEAKFLPTYVARFNRNQRLFKLCRQHYWRTFRSYALHVNIPIHLAHPHILKHCTCTYLLENQPANVVQRRAGHVNGANTLKYAEVSEAKVDAVIVEGVGL